jgi:rhodanese-related sulfurtransferase
VEVLVISVAAVAVLAALAALSSARSAKAKAEEVELDARRRVENAAEQLSGELETLKQLLATLASGAQLSREQVLEGRLWSEASPQQGLELVQRGARVIDVRTPAEAAGGVIPKAILIPVDELEARLAELPKDGAPTVVCCAGGGRSAAACEFLSRQGFTNLFNLEGGMNSWSGPRVRP